MNLSDAEALVYREMAHWGLHDWEFQWMTAYSQFGVCWWKPKVIRLSRLHVELNDEERVLDIVRHEIAHALAGATAGHGWEWQIWCRKVGARPERCYDEADTATPPKRWVAQCPSCHEIVMTRQELHKSTRDKKPACSACCNGVWQAEYVLNWIDTTTLEM
jgi:predicted SprT family Zn-dependent metalloprotease